MRVVLDTSILVSALVFPGGAPEGVYRLVLEGRIEMVTSPTLLAELGRVLGTKFGWEATRIEEAVRQLARLAIVVRPSITVEEIAADPSDDRVLEAAAEGDADAIASGDRHVLDLRAWRGIRALRASELLAEIG